MTANFVHLSLTRSNASHADMSERITLSPGFKPSRTWTALTELLPRRTLTRTASSLEGRVGPGDVTFDDAVARVDRGALADLDVPRLRLRDLQLRLQPVPLHDFGERCPGRDTLPRLDRHFLEDAGDARPHAQRLDLGPFQLREGPKLLDARPLRLELRLLRLGVDGETLFLDVVARLELPRAHLRELQRQARDEPLLAQPLVGLRLQLRLVEVRLDCRRGRLLIEQLLLEPDAGVYQVRLPCLELPIGVERVALELRVGHFQEDRFGKDVRPRLHEQPLDARVRGRGDLADPLGLGNERARPPHLPLHRAALDRVGQDRALVHGRRRGLQTRQAERDEKDRGDAGAGEEDSAPVLLLRDVFPDNVHDSALIRARSVPRTKRPKSLTGRAEIGISQLLMSAHGTGLSEIEQGVSGGPVILRSKATKDLLRRT